MSAIPLHLQRRFEQRWASRFPLPVASIISKLGGPKGTTDAGTSPHRAATAKETPAGLRWRGFSQCSHGMSYLVRE
jgi:hypothetical protein